MLAGVFSRNAPRGGNGPKRGAIRRNLIHTAGMVSLVALLIASGAGVTFALWTASTTATSSASGAQLAVSANFGGALSGFSFQNHQNTVTGTVTVTNTTDVSLSQSENKTAARPVSTQLGATVTQAGAAMASQFSVRAWPSSTAACTVATPPASAITGNWAGLDDPLTATLAPGASAQYCVRVTAAERSNLGVAAGTFTITPTATSTITVGGSSWTATATAPPITQTTSHIYPAATLSTSNWMRIADTANTTCLDVNSASDTAGQSLISFACKANSDTGKANQRWRLEANGTYYRIVTQLSSGRAFVAADAATTLGSTVVMSDAGGDTALWQAQLIPGGVHQLVNKANGLCLTRGATANGVTPMIQSACAATTAQRFTFTADGFYGSPLADPSLQLSCNNRGDGIRIGWGEAPTGLTYTLSRSYGANGPWASIRTGLAGASVDLDPTASWQNGPMYFQISDGTNAKQVATTKSSTRFLIWETHTLRCVT